MSRTVTPSEEALSIEAVPPPLRLAPASSSQNGIRMPSVGQRESTEVEDLSSPHRSARGGKKAEKRRVMVAPGVGGGARPDEVRVWRVPVTGGHSSDHTGG